MDDAAIKSLMVSSGDWKTVLLCEIALGYRKRRSKSAEQARAELEQSVRS